MMIFEEDKKRQWSCSFCTFLNHADLTACEICGNPRDSAVPILKPPPQSKPKKKSSCKFAFIYLFIYVFKYFLTFFFSNPSQVLK